MKLVATKLPKVSLSNIPNPYYLYLDGVRTSFGVVFVDVWILYIKYAMDINLESFRKQKIETMQSLGVGTPDTRMYIMLEIEKIVVQRWIQNT